MYMLNQCMKRHPYMPCIMPVREGGMIDPSNKHSLAKEPIRLPAETAFLYRQKWLDWLLAALASVCKKWKISLASASSV